MPPNENRSHYRPANTNHSHPYSFTGNVQLFAVHYPFCCTVQLNALCGALSCTCLLRLSEQRFTERFDK